MTKFWRYFGTLTAGFTVAVALACSGMAEPTGQVDSIPTASPAQTATAAPTPTSPVDSTTTALPTQTATAVPISTTTPEPPSEQAPTPATGYDSTTNMHLFFSAWNQNPNDTREAITLAVANNDRSMVPVMIEMLRFFGDPDLVEETDMAISVITGRETSNVWDAWHEWMEWLGMNADEYVPPNGYVQWKGAFMSLIDPRFGEFLAPAAQGSRINVSEIAWGGVLPDGIPDLQNAPVVLAGEQDYLQPGDRVFGVSINGEHRAYPLRIVNAHEMANDVLGGEPIALAY